MAREPRRMPAARYSRFPARWGEQVAPADAHTRPVLLRQGGSKVKFYIFSCLCANQHLKLMFNMVDDGFIHFHAADGDGLADDQTAQRYDRDLRRSTADIHHHAAFRLKDGQACANRRSQRFSIR